MCSVDISAAKSFRGTAATWRRGREARGRRPGRAADGRTGDGNNKCCFAVNLDKSLHDIPPPAAIISFYNDRDI